MSRVSQEAIPSLSCLVPAGSLRGKLRRLSALLLIQLLERLLSMPCAQSCCRQPAGQLQCSFREARRKMRQGCSPRMLHGLGRHSRVQDETVLLGAVRKTPAKHFHTATGVLPAVPQSKVQHLVSLLLAQLLERLLSMLHT